MSKSIFAVSLEGSSPVDNETKCVLTHRTVFAIAKDAMVTADKICDVGYSVVSNSGTLIEQHFESKLILSKFKDKSKRFRNRHSSQKITHIAFSKDKEDSLKERKTTLNSTDAKSDSDKLISSPFSTNPHSTLERLRNNGYFKIANQLENVEGYPWNDIIQFQSLTMIEQLVDLVEVLHSKTCSIEEDEQNRIIQFSLKLAEEQHPEAASLIGRLRFLLSLEDTSFTKQLEYDHDPTLVEQIEHRYRAHMEEAIEQVKISETLNINTQILSPKLAARTQLSRLLSDILLSNAGRFNSGLVPIVINQYLPQLTSSKKQLTRISYVLKQLASSPLLREKLHQISKPKNIHAPANVVIRSALGIPFTSPISDLDAKKTALSALLSPLRQGKDGSCFATPLAIVLLTTHLEQCLSDFSTLLSSSKLTRSVNESTCDFPFMLSSRNTHLEDVTEISQDGTFKSDPPVPIWKAPCIVAACRAIGIESPQTALEAILPYILHDSEEKTEITLKQILQPLVKYAKKLEHNQKAGLSTLYLRATFAFDALENHPLLQVWDNAIAGMAEPDETGMVRSAVISTVMKAINEKLSELLPDSIELFKQTKKTIRAELLKRIHLQYDPMIKNIGDARGRNTSEGAFVLYDKNHYSRPNCWIRVDSPDAYSSFLSRILENVKGITKHLDRKNQRSVSQALKALSDYVIQPDFIIRCLNLYYYRNHEISQPLVNYQNIKYAPWITKCGNNFSKVVQVYLEEFQASNSISLIPEDAKHLLVETIKLGKIYHEDSPQKLIPIRIPGVHAFNLMLSHPTLQDAYLVETDKLEEWLEESISQPGKKIADSVLEMETRSGLIKLINDRLIPESKKDIFISHCNEIPIEVPLKELRSEILKNIIRLNPAIDVPIVEIALQVDNILVNSLPSEFVERLLSTSIHIADTNWSEDIYDIHFCILVNPGNGEIEIWGCQEEKGKLFPLKQDLWLNNQEWEVFIEIT